MKKSSSANESGAQGRLGSFRIYRRVRPLVDLHRCFPTSGDTVIVDFDEGHALG